MHSAKRQLCFRDCSTSSSTEGSWGRFGTFCILVMAPELSQTCHTPAMLVRLLLWVLIAPAGFLARRKTSMFSSPFFSFYWHFQDNGDKIITMIIIIKERSRMRLANIITRCIKKLNIAWRFENRAPREAADVSSLVFLSLFQRNAVIE